jgi:hypothetical protein
MLLLSLLQVILLSLLYIPTPHPSELPHSSTSPSSSLPTTPPLPPSSPQEDLTPPAFSVLPKNSPNTTKKNPPEKNTHNK